VVFLLVAGMLAVSYVFGQRHPGTGAPYESGISQGSAHVRSATKFYLVAMFFVIFDGPVFVML
jgi:NADH:ubiquinone oxidoreductase subunit 3 (subunit A)